jgi:hypothetical protein
VRGQAAKFAGVENGGGRANSASGHQCIPSLGPQSIREPHPEQAEYTMAHMFHTHNIAEDMSHFGSVSKKIVRKFAIFGKVLPNTYSATQIAPRIG